MALVDIPDGLLALVAPLAESEGLTPEIQAILLIKAGLSDWARKKGDRERKRKFHGNSAEIPGTSTEIPGKPLSPSPSPSLPPSPPPLPSPEPPTNPTPTPTLPPTPTPTHPGTSAHVHGREEVRRGPDPSLPVNAAPKPLPMLYRFDEWYAAYPKRRSPKDAQNAWEKLKPDDELVDRLIEAVKSQKTWPDWLKSGGEFIPYPASWLNARMWLDESPQQLASILPAAPPPPRSGMQNTTNEAIQGFLDLYRGRDHGH